MTMNFTEATEIRKLSPTYALELSRLLHDNWKILMCNIPDTLEKGNYKCKVQINNLPKYNSSHIRLIEQVSLTTKRLSADILFEEWGSSGRVRPTLGHLLYLLQECRLYGAADYVAKILGKIAPQRPTSGPAAKVELTPTERRQIQEPYSDIGNIVNDLDYPSSNIDQSSFIQNENINNLPHIVINQENYTANNQLSPKSVSNMIKFSSNVVPDITNLLVNTMSENHQNFQMHAESVTPNFSALLNNSQSTVPNYRLPDVSILNDTSTGTSSYQITNLPDFDALRSTSQNISVQRALGSPLPSLSLNTLLTHYPYAKLEVATNYFNEVPYVNRISGDNDMDGRFLGSGAFGSVYIAFGILDTPIAVKRINLKDLNIVRADDIVTRQFITEVEILYKYKHDNLLSLLGYSCDGMTYCLMYEYVPGGNLKDRLQCTTNTLTSLERLDIAVGTADAIAYLHTAYSTPLIHRDIKSANILLDAANQPKLCDFGLVRISSSSTTGTNQILGTSAYMPPEAHRGDVSVKMDTYSFGVVMLELLTGLPPVDYERNGNDIVTYVQDNLEDESDLQTLLDIKAGTWNGDNINYAAELYTISVKCLQEKKNARPTMVNVKNELRRLFENRRL